MSAKFRNILSNRDLDRERATSKSVKVKDRDKPRDGERERRHHRSYHGKKSGSSTRDRDSDITAVRSTSSTSSSRTRIRRSSMGEVESVSRSTAASFLESRASLPYPTFSKAHSKEAVWSREDDAGRKIDILTPDPTDLADRGKGKMDGKGSTSRNEHRHTAPPSPPLTADQRSSRKGSTSGDKVSEEKKEKEKKKEKDAKTRRSSTDPSRSSSSLGHKKDDDSKISSSKTPRRSTSTIRDSATPSRSASHKTSRSKLYDKVELPRRAASHRTKSPMNSSIPAVAESRSESTNDSDATSIAPNQPKPPSRNQWRTSTPDDKGYRKQSPIEVIVEREDESVIDGRGCGGPPPPPPPPLMPVSPPKVDYLLQNGGLNYRIPKHLLGAGESPNMPQELVQPQTAVVRVFEPYHRLLDDYIQVMAKNGSLAVATGYRSVARRLLDRLEAVFARDISSETCGCLMCEQDANHEVASGVSWGEVLELVSGRQELPSWPPFQITASVKDQMLSGEEHIPMQKLDIDVPEEYREHYIRQSRKTKEAVDKWLLGQTEQSPPEEVDDETLTFAMMTHLDPERRELFCALLGITTSTPVPKAETPPSRTRPEFLSASSLAIQRLYRLAVPPRDSETAIYMLNNPNIHNVLATLAAISNDEWEILISGRFDGFLRSGAEDNFPPSMTASAPPRPGSRSSTPFTTASYQTDGSYRPASQPYGGTPPPAAFGAPIALDEETEIAALAEIERDIYLSMEALEDAFEALHCKAEAVRRALRERGAGLSLANQARRGLATNLDARLGTPASVNGSLFESGMEEDDGIDDAITLAPDDSASNISSNRRRRPKRRSERRTPAPVEEEEEEEDGYSRRDRRR
ncbi:hypothetical protein VTN77DRAFT_8059 [Rasamsonia byssochlamydoides]|uniref:uncharacterized protein n=1 Tax=Rasamsonia byssochlamydoides TaxID=89139 RepID=UPI0037444F2C